MFKIDRKTIYWWKKRREETLRPGQTIILDNASFHKSKRTRELIEDARCKVLFLPPYSPDLNPHFYPQI